MMRRLTASVTPVLPLVFCVIWSSAFIVAKIGLRSAPALTLASIRFLCAGPLMLALALLVGQAFRMSLRDLGVMAGLGLLNNTLYLGLSFTALQTVSAGLVAVLASTLPLITALLAHFALNERLTARKLTGLLLGMAGVGAVMVPRLTFGGDDPAGVALALAGVTSFALGTVLFKRYRFRHDLLVINGVQITVGGLALLPAALWVDAGKPVLWDTRFFLALAYLALGVSVAGVLLWFYLLRKGSASGVSSYHFLNPVLGLTLAWLVLGEALTWRDILGIVPIAAGILLVTRAPSVPLPAAAQSHPRVEPG